VSRLARHVRRATVTDLYCTSWEKRLANRLLAYRVALEMEARSRTGRRGRRLRVPEVADRLLRCLVRSELAGDEATGRLDSIDDYELATQARVSVRQTRELYEEIGMGFFVREVLDGLLERDLIRVARRSVSGGYRGIRPTERGLGAVDLRPWYRRWLGFFDPPEGERQVE
jgi:hypothetical protein